jgi:excisionase family DNA binding protein
MPSQTGHNRYRRELDAGVPLKCGAYTISGACTCLGDIGRTTLYSLISEGKLEAVKLGGRTLITAGSIDKLLASLPRLSPKKLRHDGADVR